MIIARNIYYYLLYRSFWYLQLKRGQGLKIKANTVAYKMMAYLERNLAFRQVGTTWNFAK